MKSKRRVKHKRLIAVIGVLVILGSLFWVLNYYGSSDSLPEYPNYDRIQLERIVDIKAVYEGNIDQKTEWALFLQTGHGRKGIEIIRNECSDEVEFADVLLKYQTQLFEGEDEKQVIDLQTGDVLVSMSQRFCYYPHGHAAIVIDGENNMILEAKSYRAGSCVCEVSKWSKLSSFVIMRVKDDIVEEMRQQDKGNPTILAAEYAKENLDGLKYSLFKDIRTINKSVMEYTPEYTQCAHLVWYAYYVVGLDIDENRGLIIKPKDFLESDVFDIVQVFGISPDKLLNIRNE